VIISKDGIVFSNEAGLDMTMSEDMMKEEWYVNAIHSEMPRLTSARMQSFSMDKDSWVISISEEIVDEQGRNIGVVVLDIPYTTIESYLMHLQFGENGNVFILNSENEVVFHQDTTYYEDEALIQTLVDLKNKKNVYSSWENTLVSQYEIKNTDWTLVGAFELESIPIIKRQIVEIIFVGFVFILLGVVFTTIILNRLTEELKRKEEVFHKQEMDVLYSQINPHFLYNTLDTIIWQAEFNQSEDVILTTKSLAQFFRLSLNQGEKLTTLRDEINHVKQYLYIQKQRYQEKLNYEFQVEESLLDMLVPKIILQPIVENSIYHGIRELDRDGMITLTFSKVQNSEKDFDIEIKDTGIGFQCKNEKNKFPQSNKKCLGGVGLQNLHQRIQLYCGNKYGLEIHSVPLQGTIVILHLCKIEKEDIK
jgi:two-component system sensor histidine kinase YesM